jgi:hypothetical protein
MNLTEARAFVRQFARNAGDSGMYPDSEIDRAIQTVCDDFIDYVRCTRTTTALALTAGSSSLPALPSLFRPERLLRAWIPAKGVLDKLGHGDLLKLQIDEGNTGLPQFVAFDSFSTGEVYPTPEAGSAYSLKIQWYEPLTVWTPGGADPGTLNLPDDYLRQILIYGATATLQHNEPEHKFASESWKKYLAYRLQMHGRGGLSGVISNREMALKE